MPICLLLDLRRFCLELGYSNLEGRDLLPKILGRANLLSAGREVLGTSPSAASKRLALCSVSEAPPVALSNASVRRPLVGSGGGPTLTPASTARLRANRYPRKIRGSHAFSREPLGQS